MEVRKVEKLGNRCNTTQEASKTNKQTNTCVPEEEKDLFEEDLCLHKASTL